MSNWGTTEIGGDPVSAWEFRTMYLSDGVVFDNFYCPFCQIRLAACLIYSETEPSVAPHFSARWGEHRFGCDGGPEPAADEDQIKRLAKSRIKRTKSDCPEELIDRPHPRIRRANYARALESLVTLEAVQNRRREVREQGLAVSRTYLIQPIVEAYNIALGEVFKEAKQRKWSSEARNTEIQNVLSALPLRLVDRTNYSNAFRKVVYLNWRNPRIYHGKGIVERHDDGFMIVDESLGKGKTELKPFNVVVSTELVGDQSPLWHRALLDKLNRYTNEEIAVRWYAYGSPEELDHSLSLRIDNLDYLYLKVAFVERK